MTLGMLLLNNFTSRTEIDFVSYFSHPWPYVLDTLKVLESNSCTHGLNVSIYISLVYNPPFLNKIYHTNILNEVGRTVPQDMARSGNYICKYSVLIYIPY
jgi:hypothetical protein